MLINVQVGNIFGNYPCEEFTIEVNYDDDYLWGRGNFYIDFDAHKEFKQKLQDILLGRVSPVDLKSHSDRLVYKGEIIAKLHIKNIMENWSKIDFSKTPWRQEIDDLKRAYVRKIAKQDLANNETHIEVSFSFHDDWHSQQGGAFTITPQVARWLGEQLILASQGDIEFNGARIKIKKDNILVSPKKK